MNIEAEVESSFQEVQGGGGGECAEPCPTAQERSSSIGRPEWQPTGCGGCGPSSERDHNIPSVFDCEHFQFIDDEEDEVSCDDVVPPTQAQTGQGMADAAPPPAAPPPAESDELSGRQQSDEMGESESRAQHAVKRQVSFDDQQPKELKSVLKKGKQLKKQKNRVVFDEVVTLYSDENERVQMLALTTGPDIVYHDVFYMFEPPIEYQDVPPFEPPAEYRDSAELPQSSAPVVDVVEEEEQCVVVSEDAQTAEPCCTEVPSEAATPDQEVNRSDVAVSKETESTDSATDENITHSGSTDQQPPSESTLESDKLFERFLEAEREFAVDEELNSVFHALETDFANDDRNGALDDNFFRKLISLLSSAEGDVTAEVNDYFSEPKLQVDLNRDAEDDDNSQTHSRTLSEADSDCSISSQDTIIVRFGEDENEQTSGGEPGASLLFVKPENGSDIATKDAPDDDPSSALLPSEKFDDVFAEVSESASSSDEKPPPPRPLPRESLLVKTNHVAQAVAKLEKVVNNGESLSRQSSGEQSVNSGNSQDLPQDADDSTSSDSRSGEVEEEIRLDDIGYDEEDAEDYDEESFRGMAHGNSKIRRIIKKNALQCTLFRGIEAKRRQQPGAKYPRPKSPLLSQESLVEKLKWLTTIDEHKDADNPQKFLSGPPDVILSTGGVPVSGSIPHSASSEDDISNQTAQGFQLPPSFYQVQPRHVLPPNSKAGYYVRRDGFPPTHHPSLPRQRVAFPAGHAPQQMMHTLPYTTQNRVVATHPPQVQQWSDQQSRPVASMTVPRNFRDWRIIQRITGNRGGEGSSRSGPPQQVAADYVRCPNGTVVAAYPDVGNNNRAQQQQPANKDELEQFVEKDSKRMDMIRRRYSVAEAEEDDPTFGFARRPSVRGVQNRIQQSNPSENIHGHGKVLESHYALFEDQQQHVPGTSLVHRYAGEQVRVWNRDPSWQPQYGPPGTPVQGGSRSQVVVPLHIHRASVALTELPGNATIPYTHRKVPGHPDTRYHSYAESMYGSTRTLPTTVQQQGWLPAGTAHAHQISSPPMLQVPPPPHSQQDERGVPEGASSSPKISSDSLYHAPVVPEPHKEDSMIYYSLNV